MEETKIISKRFHQVDSHLLTNSLADGAYDALKKALTMAADDIVKTVLDSGLRGRGGAGFPAGRKWSFIPKDTGNPIFLTVNCDEGEPGTFKDREIVLNDPHLLLEGILITSIALGCERAYIYIRGEFAKEARFLETAIAEARTAGLIGQNILDSGKNVDIWVHRGAGAYICGEETGMLSSIEGKPGKPKLKPPFPAVKGLFGCPTVVNNVETLATVPPIINNGAEWYRSFGSENNAGTRLYGISGHVNKPGVYELPMGVTIRELIYDVAGGIRNGKTLKGVIPGGISAPVLTAEEIDIKHDFDTLMEAGSMAGSAGLIVMDEDTDMVDVATNAARFYAHESCGQCSPCREGTKWLANVLMKFHNGEGTEEELDMLLDVGRNMERQTICVLSDAAAMATRGFIEKYRDEFLARCKDKKVTNKTGVWQK
jgi:NADH-quinone oxidoreductase subunit F